jgi:seryl-tRNA(Sec) selenium transferase
LSTPIIGRIADHTLLFDLRTLEDEETFLREMAEVGEV